MGKGRGGFVMTGPPVHCPQCRLPFRPSQVHFVPRRSQSMLCDLCREKNKKKKENRT